MFRLRWRQGKGIICEYEESGYIIQFILPIKTCSSSGIMIIIAEPTATGVTGKVGVITRTDGTKQVTVNGRPVYLFVGDKKVRATNGQDVKKVWFVVAPSGAQIN